MHCMYTSGAFSLKGFIGFRSETLLALTMLMYARVLPNFSPVSSEALGGDSSGFTIANLHFDFLFF